MEKIKANWHEKQLMFNHFIVKRESPNFVGVYKRCGQQCGQLITSAPTLQLAARKAKLLEMGYVIGYENAKDFYEGDDRWY